MRPARDDAAVRSAARDRTRRIVVVSFSLAVALAHVVPGRGYRGPLRAFVTGYMTDILVPMMFYLLLCLVAIPAMRSWRAKASLVTAAGASVETAQYFGVPLFGSTFDPVDYAMYAAGAAIAALLDTVVLPRVLRSWR